MMSDEVLNPPQRVDSSWSLCQIKKNCTYFVINVFIPFLEFGAPPFNLMHYRATQFACTNRLSLHICISGSMYSLYKPNPKTLPVEKRKIYHHMQQAKGSLEYPLTAEKWGLGFLILKQWCIKLWMKFHSSLFHSKLFPYPSNITTIKSDQIYFFVKHGGNLQCVPCKLWTDACKIFMFITVVCEIIKIWHLRTEVHKTAAQRCATTVTRCVHFPICFSLVSCPCTATFDISWNDPCRLVI